MSDFNRSEKIIAEKTVCVLLVRGENSVGDWVYAYVGVRGDKLQEFIEAQNKPGFDPAKYGIVVASGEGEPSDEVKAMIEQDYGFSHEKMTDIVDGESAKNVALNITHSIRDKYHS